jgi:hypothetical protein
VPDQTPISSPSPEITVTTVSEFENGEHCIVTVTAVAFLDSNTNAAWDNEEIPLPGILFHLTPSGSSNANVITNQIGEAFLSGPYGPCEGIRVFAEPPPGLKLTTSATILISSSDKKTRYLFGFEFEPGFVKRTPDPQSILRCEILRTDLGTVFDIRSDTEGHVWVSTGQEIIEFTPGLNIWKSHSIDGGLSLGILREGRVVAGFGEVNIFNGSEWELLHSDGQSFLVGAVSGSMGDLWVLSTFSLNRFNAVYEHIESIPIVVSNFGALAVTPDDTLWITGVGHLDLVALPAQDRNQGESDFFVEYDLSKLDIQTDNLLQNVVAAQDGSLWFTTGSLLQAGGQAINFNPLTDSWTIFDADTTNFALSANHVNSIAVSTDGSVWLAAGFYGLIHLIPSPSGFPEDARIDTHLTAELQGQYLDVVGIENSEVIWAASEGSLFRCESSK